MAFLRASGRYPQLARWLPCALATLLLLALQAGGEPLRLALRFERAAVLDGQWWRLFSAHAVHLSLAHCLLNIAGLWLAAAWTPGGFGARALLARWLLLGGGISALLLAVTAVPDYVGLSGVLYGLFVMALLPQAWRGDGPAALALAGVAGWAAWQWLDGPAAAEERLVGGHIVAAAHLAGMALALGWLGARRLAARNGPACRSGR
ncbi:MULTISPECIES: rhombosortase [Cupriavidus]